MTTCGTATDPTDTTPDREQREDNLLEVRVELVGVQRLQVERPLAGLIEHGEDPDEEFSFHFDNVPFVLNVLDVLADDKRFVDIRTRRPSHRTLTKINEVTESARKEADRAREKYLKDFDTARSKAQKDFDDQMAELAKRTGVNRQQAAIDKLQAQMQGQQKLDVALQGLKDKRDKSMKASQTNLELAVRKVQDDYKLWAVLLPPIPPLIVAFIVFFNRRASEREGVNKSRLR